MSCAKKFVNNQVLMIYNQPKNVGDRNVAYAVSRLLVEEVLGGTCTEHLDIRCINARSKLRRLVPLLRRLRIFSVLGPSNFTRTLWYKLFLCSQPVCGAPRFIVSRLGKPEHANVALADYYGAYSVSVGDPKKLSRSEFSLVITNDENIKDDNAVYVETMPSAMFETDVSKARQRFEVKHHNEISHHPVWCMLVGGDCPGYVYRDEDWSGICSLMNECAQRFGVKWVLSTSRRTGRQGEAALQQALADNEWLVDAIWWTDNDNKELAGYLGVAEVFVVTQDSESMLSECVSLGKPVFAYTPIETPNSSTTPLAAEAVGRIDRFIEGMTRKNRVKLIRGDENIDAAQIQRALSEFDLLPREQRWDRVLVKELYDKNMVSTSTGK